MCHGMEVVFQAIEKMVYKDLQQGLQVQQAKAYTKGKTERKPKNLSTACLQMAC